LASLSQKWLDDSDHLPARYEYVLNHFEWWRWRHVFFYAKKRIFIK
jgi:hypothetical protein